MAAESFRVSWSRFPAHVLSALDNLREDEDFVDVSIYCGRQLIKAHRNVLSASSAYFKEIFKSNPSSHPVVILCDVDYVPLRRLVDFMYHGEIEVPTPLLDDVLRLGQMLQVQGISTCKGAAPEEPRCAASSPDASLPLSDVTTPECVISEPAVGAAAPVCAGRRRRRSRRRTSSGGAEPGHVTPPYGRLVPGGSDHVTQPAEEPGSCRLSVKAERLEEPAPPPRPPESQDIKLLQDDSEQSGVDMTQYSSTLFSGCVGSRRPLTGAERARRYRERKKLKKLYEALLGGSPQREQLTVQL